jgi:hypothetical protein
MRDGVGLRDPAESWELRFTEAEGGSYFRSERASHPYTPRRAEDIPDGARESLTEACGIRDLSQMFIIPWAVRSVGALTQKVISPNSVLALGDRAVGLWTEKPQPGVKVSIPLERVAAIEDVAILLYGRLSFIPFGNRLTIRYNTVARHDMEPALLDLRRKLVASPQPLPDGERTTVEVPFKWKIVLRETFVRLTNDAPVVFSFATIPRKHRHGPEYKQLLVLNPFELVYLCDPMESTEPYGVDSWIVPRSRITGAQMRDGCVEVSSNGASVLLSMAPSLREAAIRWVG